MTTVIDDKTRIPLFTVLSCVPVLIGGIMWLTSIDAKASAAQSELQDTKVLLRLALEKLQVIDNKVSRIEGWISNK